MSAALVKGQNGPLPGNEVVVAIRFGAAADLSALLVTEAGKVRSDADFVFFNQPRGPGVQLRPAPSGQPAALQVSLNAVPGDIAQIRAVISLDDTSSTFGRYPAPTAIVSDLNGNPLYEYRIEGLDSETVVIAVELYRRNNAWKVRAVGQGYAGGFAALVTDHGVSVDDAPAPRPAPITSIQQAPNSRQPTAAASPPASYPPSPPPAYPSPQVYPSPPPQAYPSSAPLAYPPSPPPAYPSPPPQVYPSSPPPAYPPSPPPAYPPAPVSGFPAQGSGYPPPLTPGPPPVQPDQRQPGEVSLSKDRPVTLEKGQRVTLRKDGGVALSFIRMGLGWDPVKRGGLFGGRAINVDLDASVVLFAGTNPVDAVYYGQLTSKDGSIRHQGDNLTGEGEGDDEVILVDLTRVPAHVTLLLFIVTSYQGHTFEQIQNAFCRLVDNSTDTELARYSLRGGNMAFTAMAMAKVFRVGNDWKMQAIGEGFQAKHPGQAIPQLGRFITTR
ncbi:TerD family protein [Nocardia sp. NBC_01499]|uniref:TerD family protein n=1 Tax=Nocardia sp. NBC_01499 TaxID=2903597 RepID=UPI003862D714